MQCPFCQQTMKSLDSGPTLPRLSMNWICETCPNEVRVLGERRTHDADAKWEVRRMSIFVFHREKEYCLHWDFVNNFFYVIDPGAEGHVLSTPVMPTTVTPSNALDKLKLFLVFS